MAMKFNSNPNFDFISLNWLVSAKPVQQSKVSWGPGPVPGPGSAPLDALCQCNSPLEAQVKGVLAEVQLLPPARHR